jgi:2-oxoisovalerate dehydrogenase E1 component alpha subunit
VTPTIETQYAVAPGTALMQRRHGGIGISVVTGGDAGSAEGDFYSGMNWSTRPGHELPVLMCIAHNRFGISTAADTVQNSPYLNRRGDGFGIRNACVDGNDAVAAWAAIGEAMEYVRNERKPFILQGNVSRLYGHSSSSGANRHDEPCCIQLLEQRLVAESVATAAELAAVWQRWQDQLSDALKIVLDEPMPAREHVLQHVYYDGPAGN